MKITDFLKLPETRTIKDLDNPQTTITHSEIIRKKIFLRNLYSDFYREFLKLAKAAVPQGPLIEIGSGGGFINEIIPSVIASDILKLPNISIVYSALNMPFKANSVSAFYLNNVFHHINDPAAFLTETARCLKVGGALVMLEPANTFWGRFIRKNFHHEPYNENCGWRFESAGPLSSSNLALPWIVFIRDQKIFNKQFPNLKIKILKAHTPLRYIISGGASMRQLLPLFCYIPVKLLETVISVLNKYIGMFYTIKLIKTQ